MNTADIPDAETIVGQHWPLYGPYDGDRTIAAGAVLGELVRYLNYATGQGADTALPYASTAGSLVGQLKAGVGDLDQTLRQLIDRCQHLQLDPTLYDHDQRDDHAAAIARAQQAIEALSDATVAADQLYGALNSAHTHLSHLGHHIDGDDE